MQVSLGTIRGLILATTAAAVLSACAPAKMVRQWSDPAHSGPGYKKLLVLGIWDEAGPRRVLEDTFVREIKATGADAVPSYRFIPQDGQTTREIVIKAVEDSGADGVVLTTILGRDEKSEVRESDRVQFGAGTTVYQSVDSAYAVSWAGFYRPPEISSETVWNLETKVFDAKSRAPVWNGVIALKDPKNLQLGATTLAQTVVKALQEKKML